MTGAEREARIEELLGDERWLRRIAWSVLGDGADVDDVMQEAWLAHLREPSAAVSSRARLGTIVRNVAVSLVRRRVKGRDVEASRPTETAGDDVAEAVERVELYRAVLEWILELEEPYRTVLLLRYASQLEPIEIARRLDLPASTVRVRLRRGLARLRERFDREHGEDDRRRWGLLLFGVVPPRRAALVKSSALVAAAVVATLAASLLFVMSRDDAPAPPHLRSHEALVESPEVAPRRVIREKRSVAVPSADDTITEREAVCLQGVVRIESSLVPPDARVRLLAEPFMTGREMDLPALLEPRRDFEDPISPVAVATVPAGQPFQLDVPERGRYCLHIGIEGVPGLLAYWTTTDGRVDATVRVLDLIEVHLEGETLPAEVQLRPMTEDGPQVLRVPLTDGLAEIEGPFVPGVGIAHRHPGDGNLWRSRLLEAEATLHVPRLAPPRRIEVVSHEDGTRRLQAHARMIHVTEGMRVWRAALPVHDGVLEWHEPRRGDRHRSVVTIGAEERWARRLPPAGLPDRIVLRPTRPMETKLVDSGGAPRRLLDVVVCDDVGPRWRGRTDERGHLDAEPREIKNGVEPITPRPRWLFAFGAEGEIWRLPVTGDSLPETIVLAPPRPLVVRVADAEGAPVRNARVWIVPFSDRPVLELVAARTATSDEQGLASFPAIGGGPWHIEVDAPGRRSVSFRSPPTCAAPLEVRLSGAAAEGRRLRLLVRDETGAPFVDARVEVWMPGFPTPFLKSSGADGRVRYDDLACEEPPRFEVLAEGREMSLTVPARAAFDDEEIEVRLLPVRRAAIVEADLAAPAGWALCRAPAGGRLRVRPLARDGTVMVTRERQHVTAVRPGARPLERELRADPDGTAAPPWAPGPRLLLQGLAAGRTVTLRALRLDDTSGPLHLPDRILRAFDRRVETRDGRLELAVSPGRYELAVGGAARPLRLEIDGDRTLDLTNDEIRDDG